MDFSALFTSEAAITLYVTIVLFVYRYLRDRFTWNTERWEGLVSSAFNAAEKAGLQSGHQKLDLALKVFTRLYEETYKKPPSIMDLKDATLDFGKLALELKLAKASA